MLEEKLKLKKKDQKEKKKYIIIIITILLKCFKKIIGVKYIFENFF